MLESGRIQAADLQDDAPLPTISAKARLRMHTRLLVILLLLGLGELALAYEVRAPREVDLTGRWALNKARSDDADALLLQRLEKQLQRERRWRDAEVRAQRADAPAELEISRPQAGRALAQLRRALELSPLLEITQSEAGAKLEIRGESSQRRFTTGRSAMSMPEGQLANAEVGWDGEWFVIERKVRKGPKMVERYRLMRKTGQLQSEVSWSGSDDDLLSGVKIRRIFDRTEGSLPPPDPDVGPVR
jgi:hypothetical protein